MYNIVTYDDVDFDDDPAPPTERLEPPAVRVTVIDGEPIRCRRCSKPATLTQDKTRLFCGRCGDWI